MRTKTLLLTAALSAAGLATSMAQVYSVNAVGYVNVGPIGPGAYAILSIPLNGSNNNLNTTFTLPPGYDGSSVIRWDPATQAFSDAIQWFDGVGWFNPTGPVPDVNPGEGFFFQNLGAAALNVTFVGEVPQGTISHPVAGGNNYAIKASAIPQSLRLGTGGQAGTLEFPAADGDSALIWNVATQSYLDAYQYFDGVGWFSPTDPAATPDGPIVSPAQGFFTQKVAPGTVQWTRTFTVN